MARWCKVVWMRLVEAGVVAEEPGGVAIAAAKLLLQQPSAATAADGSHSGAGRDDGVRWGNWWEVATVARSAMRWCGG